MLMFRSKSMTLR